MTNQTKLIVNPLTNFMRQPKIYIRLPSQGLYWSENSLIMPPNQELPVYSMTAKDELTFKTPDALMNGQAVVDVIQSCIPNIKNAWDTPNLDLDLILIAIRIATFGETMTITHSVPGTLEKIDTDVDLRVLVDNIGRNSKWIDKVEIDENLTCYIKPLTYKHITQTNIKSFEAQKLLSAVNNDGLDDSQKLEIFNASFKKMTDVTTDLIADSITAVQTPNEVVTDRVFINEFVQNADFSLVQKIQDHIAEMKKYNGIRPIILRATEEQIAQGAPETYELPITMDNSDFFGQGS